VVAQLRDVLAAENSTIVAKKNQDRRPVRPQSSKLHSFAIHIRQNNAGKPAAEGVAHGNPFSDATLMVSSRRVILNGAPQRWGEFGNWVSW
jgi:hypothetical protein